MISKDVSIFCCLSNSTIIKKGIFIFLITLFWGKKKFNKKKKKKIKSMEQVF